jgi:Potassium-transporting ATPase A subunit
MSMQYEPCKFWDSPPRPLERRGYRLARVDLQHEMSWRTDASSFAFFSLISAASLFAIPLLQFSLPFNVSGARFQKPHSAFKFHRYVCDLLAIVLAPDAPTRFLAVVGRIRRCQMAPWAPESGEALH